MKRKLNKKIYVDLNKLRGILAEKRISHVKCADAIGISKFQFARKISGEVQFWIGEVIEIANFLKLTPEEFNTIFLKEIV